MDKSHVACFSAIGTITTFGKLTIPKLSLPQKKTLSDAVVLRSDSGDLAAAQALGDEIKTFADHLDGAFLNAAIGILGPFDAATPNNYDDMFNVNVRGLYFQLQSLLPLLGNPSSVVFTSSIAGCYRRIRATSPARS